LRHLASIDLGDHDIRHQVLLLDQELHRSFYSPFCPSATNSSQPNKALLGARRPLPLLLCSRHA
ncbi:hypothetical protein ABT346_30450, partial [Micromonospora peucetia]|uniref:hypothetical protein n=1 Tax=Micromonospora peucetia TaxID=47871 RepID=UPI003316B03E